MPDEKKLLVCRDEASRLQTLRELDLLDNGPIEEMEHLTSLCSETFDAAYCFVCLVDSERVYLLSNHGMPDVREWPRAEWFCSYTIAIASCRKVNDDLGEELEQDILVCRDLRRDWRFENNRLVTGGPLLEFYAGVPLRVRGKPIGTLCVLDSHPDRGGVFGVRTEGQFGLRERAVLMDFAASAVTVMTSRLRVAKSTTTTMLTNSQKKRMRRRKQQRAKRGHQNDEPKHHSVVSDEAVVEEDHSRRPGEHRIDFEEDEKPATEKMPEDRRIFYDDDQEDDEEKKCDDEFSRHQPAAEEKIPAAAALMCTEETHFYEPDEVKNVDEKDSDDKVAFVTGNPSQGESALHMGSLKLTEAPQKEGTGETVALSVCDDGAPLPAVRTKVVAMLGVPRRFVSSDLIGLLQPWRSQMTHVRVTRHCEPPLFPSNCGLVILELATVEASSEVYVSLHGRAFNSFEPERCSLCFVEYIAWQTDNEDSTRQDDSDEDVDDHDILALTPKTAPKIESCVVCLEKFSAKDCLFTMACDHTFHMHCLERWKDAPCPVCRYDQVGATELASCCDVCFATLSESPLWVCLLCGQCGCEQEHAHMHYERTKHAYALDVTTRLVWDFASEGFVHRVALQKNGEDRKQLSAIQDPSAPRGFLDNYDSEDDYDDRSDDVSDAATVSRRKILRATTAVRDFENNKLEGMAVEFNELMRTQLARQRETYEARIRDFVAREEEAAAVASKVELREMRALDAKNTKLRAELGKLNEELEFYDEINRNLEADLSETRRKNEQAEISLSAIEAKLDEEAKPLEKELARLLRQVDEANQQHQQLVAEDEGDSLSNAPSDSEIYT